VNHATSDANGYGHDALLAQSLDKPCGLFHMPTADNDYDDCYPNTLDHGGDATVSSPVRQQPAGGCHFHLRQLVRQL
jgi:hypothetical protein